MGELIILPNGAASRNGPCEAVRVTIPRGGAIFCQDEDADAWFEIESGVVRTSHLNRDGRRQLTGFFFDGDGSSLSPDDLTPILLTGEIPQFNHFTAGYPDFTEWPNAWRSSTHQTMYYRWIERAYLGGLRLLLQHATGNSVLCDDDAPGCEMVS